MMYDGSALAAEHAQADFAADVAAGVSLTPERWMERSIQRYGYGSRDEAVGLQRGWYCEEYRRLAAMRGPPEHLPPAPRSA